MLADKICGLMIVNSVLAALHSRASTGEGQWVDVPMADAMLAFNLVEHLGGGTFDPPRARSGGTAPSCRIAGPIVRRTGGSA